MLRLPCSLLSLDIQDVMGTHILNIGGTLTKSRLDSNGKMISSEVLEANKDGAHDDHDEGHFDPSQYEKAKNSIKNKEGCNVKGYIVVNKVPGNFHISSHAYGSIIQRLASDGLFTFDVSHKINHLSFGEDKDIKYIKKSFGENHGVLNPLDNTERTDKMKLVYEYYLKVLSIFQI